MAEGLQPTGRDIVQSQYEGLVAANPNARLNIIDRHVIDGRNIRQEMVDLIGDLPPESALLDIGCADGGVIFDFRNRRGYQGTAIGIDADASSVDLAKQREDRMDIPKNIFVQGDMNDLRFPYTQQPIPDKSIDVVINSFSLHHATDIVKALSEVYRVMKDDGLFLVTANSVSQKAHHTELLQAAAAELGITPPQRFAENFSVETAPDTLGRFFTITHTVPQVTEMQFSEDEFEDLRISLDTYRSEFVPAVVGEDRTTVTRLWEKMFNDEIEERGLFVDNIDRRIYVCRKRLVLPPDVLLS